MDNVTSSVITQVIQSLMVPIKKHLGFLISSTKNVKNMKKKMEELNFLEQDFRHDLDEAVIKNHVVSNLVSPWLDDVKEMNEKAENIPTGGVECFNIVKRYKAGRDSYNIFQEIQALKTRKSDIVFTNKQIPLAELASTSSTGPSTSTPNGTQNNFMSRDSIYKAALKSLQPNNESQKMIALCGMGGVGKTTMMEQLKKDVEKSNLFDRVVKVVIGEAPNLIALQRAIAIYIDQKDLKEETKDARADRLRKMFEKMSKQGKKTLVIMDDLWSEIELNDVGLSPLPTGFKMMFTSRYERYCTYVGVEVNSTFKVGLLNNDEAKTLFFKVVGPSDGADPTLQKIGEDIVKRCRGLPIAIVTIAKRLAGDVEEAWKKTLWRLEKDDLKDLESITHRVFEMSYENLKEADDKEIFLLCGLFPDDFNIRTEDLFRFGWGLGLFKDAKTLATARSDMKICVNNLIRANLLTESDYMGCVKIHDLVRAFVLDKVSEVKQASIMNHENTSQQVTKDSYDRILLKCTGMTKFSVDFSYPNLSMLMLMDGSELLKFPEDIYDRMKKLEVMSYEKMHIPMLPIAFEHSTKLRTLCLRSCSFINDDISFLGSLSNLETLSFVDCNLSWLPSTVGKLKKLRLLDLTGCVNLRIDDGVFQNLENLEELYMRMMDLKRALHEPVRFTLVCFTDENCYELEILSRKLLALELEFFENKAQPKHVSFKNLERFRISIGCRLEELKDDRRNLFRNTIQLVCDCNELMECKISDLFDKTEELHLQVNGMFHLEDVFSFSKLTILYVSECADLTCLFTANVVKSLKRLERLTISKCHLMRTLVAENSRVELIRFPKLKFMSLTDLPKMVSLWDNVIDLPEMVKLILDGLPNFTSIFTDTRSTYDMHTLLDKKVVIPRLEVLEFSRMENLKSIWSCETANQTDVFMLKKIILKNCDNLMNLFPSNPLPLLNHLEELEVKHCGSVEVLFNMEFQRVCERGECKLRSIKVSNLRKLKELWRMKGVNKSDIHIKCFKGVEKIKISKCSIFENIFTPTTTNFDLRALTHHTMCNIREENDVGGILEVDECIPNDLLHTSHHLQQLQLSDDKRVGEVLFNIDSHQPLLLSYLEELHLDNLKEMSNVWKCNWNAFTVLQHQPFQLPFQNLTMIYLFSCHKIKFLFSPLMVKYLSSLKIVLLSKCKGIEEVISSRDDSKEENTTSSSSSSHQNSTLFPHLDRLVFAELPCLKSIDGGDHTRSRTDKISYKGDQVVGSCWSLYQYPREIVIRKCNVLSILIPCYAVGQMKRLQYLEIDRCSMMTYLFTFSTLENLTQLKELKVKKCESIQVIVKEETGTSSQAMIKFPSLKTVILDDLPNLKGFFLGVNEFEWPSLDEVFINDCPHLMTFTPGAQSKTPKLKYINTKLGKHILECGLNFHEVSDKYQTMFPNYSSDFTTISKVMPWSFHNLVEINIENVVEMFGTFIIPSHVLLQLQNLEKILIEFCRDIEKVFEIELEGINNSGFSESQITTFVKIPNLTQVKLYWVNNLKYLWESSQWIVLEFPNLTTLTIDTCHNLEHVFTCSMVGCLVQLQDLDISCCDNLEVIVKEEEEERDAKVNKIIVLPRLKSLKLFNLSSLEGFFIGNDAFSFPAIDNLEIKSCPKITVLTRGKLSTPKLKIIDTTSGKWYVKTDINTFIKAKQEELHIQE